MTSGIGSASPAQRSLVETSPTLAPLGSTSRTDTPGGSSAALYQTFGATAFPTDSLGIRVPRNAEDTAIILAQAALAIDRATQEASANRITNAAAGARSGIGVAIADTVKKNEDLSTTQREKALNETKLANADAKVSSLTTVISGLSADIADLDSQILKSKSDEKNQLTQQRDDKKELLAKNTAELTVVQGEIGALKTTIQGQKEAIVDLKQSIVQSGLALLNTYSRVALQFEQQGGERAQDVVRSTETDRRLDDSGDILRSFRDSEVARDETESAQGERRQDEATMRRILDAVVGLVSGLATVMDVLKQFDTSPPPNPREAALSSGSRFMLAL